MFYCKRIAQLSDYSNITALINDGKRQMNTEGITQWDSSYPNQEVILQDIKKKQLWIYGRHFEACVTVSKSDQTVLIQRLVVSSHYQRSGIARFILTDIIRKEEAKKETNQIRISTNKSNVPIQKLLTSLNFVPCRKYKMPGREQFGSFIEFIYPSGKCKSGL